MLFRIQNLYLLIALICIVAIIVFPIGGYDWNYTFKGEEVQFEAVIDSYGVYFKNGADDDVTAQPIPFYLGFIFLGLLTAATLLSYKNRKRQLTIGRINFVLHLIMAILIVAGLMLGDQWGVEYLAKGKDLNNIDTIIKEYPIETRYGVGFYAAIVSVPLLFMANIGINRDEKLVKSLDRLR